MVATTTTRHTKIKNVASTAQLQHPLSALQTYFKRMNAFLARLHRVNLNFTSLTLWSTLTLFNTLLCILAITIWITNRQTQIKKSKSQQRKRTSKQEHDDEGDETFSRSDSDNDLEFYFNDWSRYNERRHLVMSIDVDSDDNLEEETTSDGEDEQDTDFDGHQNGRRTKKGLEDRIDDPNIKDIKPLASPQRTKMRRELFKSISHLKVFSYLSDDAFLQCLNLMEYKVLPVRGMELFTDDQPFDGSLFVVIDGEMELSCSLNSSIAYVEKPMTFTAGPGDVLTSLLSTLSGLLEEYKKVNDEFSNRFHEHCHMVNVIAKAREDNTRLIRIPPSAFLVLLQSYPQDVHQIAQTVFARCQRVTMQTLVKNLGLGFDILYSHGNKSHVACSSWTSNKDELEQVARDILSTDYFKEMDRSQDCSYLKITDMSPEVAEKISSMLALSLGSTAMDASQSIRQETFVTVVKHGDVILHSNTKANFVYFVIDGVIDVEADREQDHSVSLFDDDGKKKKRCLYQLVPGDVVGEMSCFTDEVSFVTLRVGGDQKKSALILQLPKHTYLNLLDRHSNLLMQCIRKILTVDFSPLVHLFDWGIEWMHVQAGTLLAKKHQKCDRLHVILSGRLKVGTILRSKESTKNVQSNSNYEYGRGSCIGETYILLGAEYPDDVYAVRNTELAMLPKNVLDYIMHVFPHTAIHFAKQIASRQVPQYQRKQRHTRPFTPTLPHGDISIATIAVVPLCFDSTHEAHELCKNISNALNKLAPCTLMTKSIARQSVGRKVFKLRNAVHELKMLKLLSDIEENHRLTVYQTDQKFTWWTKLCIQQADCVLLVADGQRVPCSDHLERYLIWAQGRSLVRHVQLLVLQQVYIDCNQSEKRVSISKDLSNWIDERLFIKGQHLLRKPIETHEQDVARMCRRITGMSLGLALGGGGARGLAHLGVIRALMERRVTVDICGGTSQGAFIGGEFSLLALCFGYMVTT
jgi:CRP-like cAMP-binding protein